MTSCTAVDELEVVQEMKIGIQALTLADALSSCDDAPQIPMSPDAEV